MKWLDFEASAVCTIPAPAAIDSVYFEKAVDDTSFVAKMVFRNDPENGTLYQTFLRNGKASNAFAAVNFTTMDGSLLDSVVVETFTKPVKSSGNGPRDAHFHPGDTLALKLAAIELPMFEFWKAFTNQVNSAGGVLSAPENLKGNVEGAIGYWAGYGIDLRELICSPVEEKQPPIRNMPVMSHMDETTTDATGSKSPFTRP